MSSTDNVSNGAREVKGSAKRGISLRSIPRNWQLTIRNCLGRPLRGRRHDGRRATGDAYPRLMLVPIALPLALGVAGWFAAGWAGAITAFAVGLLVDLAVVAGAALWARQIGSLIEHDDAWAVAPRPPGYRQLVEWVYRRTLR